MTLMTTLMSCASLLIAAAPDDGPGIEADVSRRLAETGAPVKVWVHFTEREFANESERAAALAALEAEFPTRALARRALRRTAPGLVDERDLPVSPGRVAEIESAGGRVHVASRWLNAVSATVDVATLGRIAALPFVERVSLVGRSVPLGTTWRAASPAEPSGDLASGARGAAAASMKGDTTGAQLGSPFYGTGFDQLEMIGVPSLHALGHTGEGVVIAVLDTGFETTHDAFVQPGQALDVIAAYDFVDDDAVVGIEAGDDPEQHVHGTIILGTMAAYLPGEIVGAAYDASYVLCKTEDVTQEVIAEEDFYVAGLEFAELNGADVATSSLGYIDWYTQADLDGETAITTQAVNVATENGVVCCTAAGNDGNDTSPATSSLRAPGDAFDVLTVAAAAVTGEVTTFSSDGPTADGRVKPEVVAMGQATVSVWPYDVTGLALADGTSMSTPLIAGAVACLIDALPSTDVPTMRERLIKSCDYFGSPVPDPTFVYGYGIPDALTAHDLAGSWQPLGGGVGGAAGVPSLDGDGSLVGTEPVTLTIASGPSSGSAFLVIGTAVLGAPFKGGTLVPDPDLVIGGLPLDGAGSFVVTAPWSPGLPSGLTTFFQAWIPDPTAPAGFAGSNALRAVSP